MKVKIILYNTEKDKTFFTLSQGIRPWGILLATSNGSFELTLSGKDTQVFNPYEIAYVPPNTKFSRKVLQPIDFHQFAFQIYEDDHVSGSLRAGKLEIPQEQVKAVIDSAQALLSRPDRSDGLILHLLCRIITDNYIFSAPTGDGAHKLSADVCKIVEYVSENPAADLAEAELARMIHLSQTGLIWKFKKEMGMTPHEYIIARRIKCAKQLLLEEDMSISDIAERCGYSNAYYFSNAFKRVEGVSPTEFRKKAYLEK